MRLYVRSSKKIYTTKKNQHNIETIKFILYYTVEYLYVLK